MNQAGILEHGASYMMKSKLARLHWTDVEDKVQGSKPGGREIILKAVMKYRKKKLRPNC